MTFPFCLFFSSRRRHTRLQGDWSSDVCSSDLKLKRISIADLIAYRQSREKLVDRISEFTVTTEIGPLQGYAYMTHFDQVHHMAVVYGRIDGRNVPTRLHRANLIRDMFGGTNTVAKVLHHFKREGQGVIVFLRDGSVGVPVSAIPKGGVKSGERNGDRNGDLGSD